MMIYNDERVDEVNDKLTLIQKPDGLTFGTDALLLAGYVSGKFGRGCELGGGSGIISMLLVTRDKINTVTVYEVQKEYADLIRRNAEHNRLEDRISAEHKDIRELTADEDCEIAFTNPPYMKCDSGAQNATDAKTIARHEICGDIRDFCKAAAKKLKFGGSFYAVYRPDRLSDIMAAMRECKLEPKRMTFVHGSALSTPSMVLVEGRRGGKPGVKLTRPLILYPDASVTEYGADGNYIMNNGRFPDDFN
jgi:tRNA1(Val) A37 N6-methylase TrmN6